MQRMPRLQLALGLVGATAFCIYSRSWRDSIHLVYDVPAGIAVFTFIAQLLLEGLTDGPSSSLIARLGLLCIMTLSAVGSVTGRWCISGHVTCMLSVTLVQRRRAVGLDPGPEARYHGGRSVEACRRRQRRWTSAFWSPEGRATSEATWSAA